MADPSFKEGEALQIMGVHSGHRGLFVSALNPHRFPCHHHGRWGFGERQRVALHFLLSFHLFTHCPSLLLRKALECFCNSRHHISGQTKMSLFLCLKLSPLKLLFACENPKRLFELHSILVCLYSRSEKPKQHLLGLNNKEDCRLHSQIFPYFLCVKIKDKKT